jgi:hypothetical protein
VPRWWVNSRYLIAQLAIWLFVALVIGLIAVIGGSSPQTGG